MLNHAAAGVIDRLTQVKTHEPTEFGNGSHLCQGSLMHFSVVIFDDFDFLERLIFTDWAMNVSHPVHF